MTATAMTLVAGTATPAVSSGQLTSISPKITRAGDTGKGSQD